MKKITLQVSESMFEVLATLAALECKTIPQYCGDCVYMLTQTDIEEYFCQLPERRQMLEAKIRQ